jgi:hypothetical protein
VLSVESGVGIVMSAGGDKAASTGKTDWETPEYILDWCKSFWRIKEFDLDPASDGYNNRSKYFWMGPHVPESCLCGLCNPWQGHVWLNPPYGKGLQLWTRKLVLELPNVQTITTILPANTGSRWFGELIHHSPHVVFLTGRVAFERDGQPVPGNTVDSVIMHFDSKIRYDTWTVVDRDKVRENDYVKSSNLIARAGAHVGTHGGNPWSTYH